MQEKTKTKGHFKVGGLESRVHGVEFGTAIAELFPHCKARWMQSCDFGTEPFSPLSFCSKC